MIKLVKNELCKIFHKKAIYVLGILTILLLALQVYMVRKIDTFIGTSPEYYENLEKGLENYNLNDYEEREWYVADKTEVDMWKEASKYDASSWQYTMILNHREEVYCMNEAKYTLKDNEKYEECSSKYQEFLNSIKVGDWKIYVEEQKKAYEEEISIYKEQINRYKEIALSTIEGEENPEKEIAYLEKEIKTSEIYIEGIQYRLDKNIPPASTKDSGLIEEYVSNSIAALEYSKEEEEYTVPAQLAEKRRLEKTIAEAKYRLDNAIPATRYPDAIDIISSEFTYVVLFVVIAAVMIAGTVVSEEYSKGTIKQLLVRPYTRAQILTSKYIACLITFAVFFLFYYVADVIAIGLASGFETVSLPMVIYNFETHSVMEIGLSHYCLMNVLALLPEYLIILTVSFTAGTILGNSGVAIAVGFFSAVLADIINGIAMSANIKALRFFPTMCWDFTSWLFGGTPTYKYANFTVSVVVCVITYILLLGISYFVFQKKNIKNQ